MGCVRRPPIAILLGILSLVMAAGTAAQSASKEAIGSNIATQADNTAKNLWIAKFECGTKAAQAVAAAQQADTNALQYSNLFATVTTFAAQPTAPAGAWTLTGKELDFTGGSTAKRAMLGFGSGRAHLLVQYELRDPAGKVLWTEKIKSQPSWWGSSGALGAVQNQGAASGKQGQDLVDALAKFMHSVKASAKAK